MADSGSILSAMVSVGGAIATAAFAFLNLKIALRSQRANSFTLRQRYVEDIRKWADVVCDDMTEAMHLCDLDPARVAGESFFDRRHRLRMRLSSMADRGRMFFPNIRAEYGEHKETAYRGYRHEVLNPIIDAYRAVSHLDWASKENNRNLRQDIADAKRKFISEVQEVVNPYYIQAELVMLTKPRL